ncbi:UNVERIFIED_CONTAM: hypothetical protein Slati_0220300 [Sesamum latifolium]|uniref:Retrotransposon gag domain-containing protein n=1 Tax=Sesamum latifolium TaxID=2727402 RepID=A0AAW2YD83_9LAMI
MVRRRVVNEERPGGEIGDFPVEEEPPEMGYEGSSQARSSQKTMMNEDMKALLKEAAEQRGCPAGYLNQKSKSQGGGDIDLRKEISDLKRHLEPRVTHPRRGSPFAKEILSTSLPSHVRLPQLACYGGEKGDPRDHVDQFVAAMDLIDSNDALHCRIFRTTLVGRAQTWFSRLPLGSIRSFEQLIRGFVQHFASNKRYPKNPGHLFAIDKRRGNHSDHTYKDLPMKSWIYQTSTPGFLSGIMAQGLRNGGLADSLIGEPAPNWDELLSRAEKFILIEESRKIRGSTRPRKEPAREVPKRNHEGLKDDPRRQMNTYTP